MADYRALCSELVDALAEWRLGGGPPEDTADADLIDRARALLAQQPVSPPYKLPEPEGPTDDELLAMRSWSSHGQTFDSDLVDYARAVLARWGRPTPQPVAVSERLDWRRPNAPPTPLSPTAQAVLDAYGDFEPANVDAMAAALVAAADQVVPEQGCPIYGLTQKENERQQVRNQFLAIAAELEAQP